VEELLEWQIQDVHLLDYGVADRLRITLREVFTSSCSLSILDIVDKLLVLDVLLAPGDDILGGQESDVDLCEEDMVNPEHLLELLQGARL